MDLTPSPSGTAPEELTSGVTVNYEKRSGVAWHSSLKAGEQASQEVDRISFEKREV